MANGQRLSEDRVNLYIDLNPTQVEQKLHELSKETREFKDRQKELRQELKDVVDKKSDEAKLLKKQLDEVSDKIKQNGQRLKELTNEMGVIAIVDRQLARAGQGGIR